MRIILADDHELVRAGIKPFLAGLADDMEVVECGDLPEALDLGARAPVDLVILDLSMPGMNGDEGLRSALAAFPGTPVVMLSASTQPADILTAARTGAAGYLPKNMSGPAMTAALKLILLGERFFPACVLQSVGTPLGDGGFAGGAALRRRNPLELLSVREREILRLMIEGGTNKEIARRLTVQEITVKVHLRNIYRKLGAANRAQAVRIALENGWRS
ncbi:response regulator [Caenispirillum bisanense]|uniref:Two component transcriptional regulator, LuxR family n=1 Tax=Caenispirillum bisanense TaxID=414052 RepID=A0A286GNX1_9PROT|nr:response regulator transcription factor [Caenispirillum bisanense]SOD96769.1 two component transcriptional regulator, LuxR family [Caenispirillum bisanense]